MKFTIYDALLYSGKPVLSGTVPMTALPGLNSPPPVNATGAFFIDYEPGGDTLTAVDNVLPVLTSYRERAPQAQFGCYALGPICDYWNIVDPIGGYRGVAPTPVGPRNDATHPLDAQSDYCLPCLYNFYPSNDGYAHQDPFWWRFAVGTIAEARRISDRPVCPFVWPQYFSAPNPYVDATTWTWQLELIKGSCDGLVLWGGSQQAWNPTAPWWLATKQVLGI